MGVGRRDERLDRQPDGLGLAVEEGAGRRRADGRGHGFGHRRNVRAVGAAERHEPRARRPHQVVVRVAMRGLDHDLGRVEARVGQALHRVRVKPGDHGRGAQGQPGGGAGCDVTGLGAGQLGDAAAGDLLQVPDSGERARRLGHGRHDLGLHQRPTRQRRAAASVDQGPNTESGVDGHAASDGCVRSRSARPIGSIGWRADPDRRTM